MHKLVVRVSYLPFSKCTRSERDPKEPLCSHLEPPETVVIVGCCSNERK